MTETDRQTDQTTSCSVFLVKMIHCICSLHPFHLLKKYCVAAHPACRTYLCLCAFRDFVHAHGRNSALSTAVRVFTHGHKDTQTDSSVSIPTADAGGNENPSAILNSPLCYHMLTANGRFFITVNRAVIRTHLIAQII